MTEVACKHCGLIQGHGNSCFADILTSKLLAMEHVVERARILMNAENDHGKLVADMKLRDALLQLDIEIRHGQKVS